MVCLGCGGRRTTVLRETLDPNFSIVACTDCNKRGLGITEALYDQKRMDEQRAVVEAAAKRRKVALERDRPQDRQAGRQAQQAEAMKRTPLLDIDDDYDGEEAPHWPTRVKAWHDEWRPFWYRPRWQLLVWSVIVSSYHTRRPRRLWSWWVSRYMEMVLLRRMLERQTDDRLARLFPPGG